MHICHNSQIYYDLTYIYIYIKTCKPSKVVNKILRFFIFNSILVFLFFLFFSACCCPVLMATSTNQNLFLLEQIQMTLFVVFFQVIINIICLFKRAYIFSVKISNELTIFTSPKLKSFLIYFLVYIFLMIAIKVGQKKMERVKKQTV